MLFSDSFGSWLKQQRKSRDWTQAQLAERVICSVALIRKFEADERRPSKQIAVLLASVLGVPTSDQDRFLANTNHKRRSRVK
jgi:transcriptional regulator with XRE-family HTH domain